ncbi:MULTISPECIES: hypothetical protein [Niastella]|uniref:DUF4139 domain-containing protein n=1 Tax=Niastella soli TaxID=2821487 RepID=A0ABS3YRL9_9BACT|nr:hypothetical protein [Niastella soli]MBO9200564.1 hypothetical protein [Niastella soli]
MLEKVVDINLSVSIVGREIIARLIFSNNTDKRIFLDKLTICHHSNIEHNLFKVLDKQRKRVDYTGVMIKRDVTREDFVEVEAGGRIEEYIILDQVYKVNKGNKYTIQYYAYNPSYKEMSEFMRLESNTVEFNY